MPGIDDGGEAAAPPPKRGTPDPAMGPPDLEGLVYRINFEGHLAALIACACENALANPSLSHADSTGRPHPGALAAIRAYETWKRSEGHPMATDTRQQPDHDDPPLDEPEVLPLSMLGRWVAWSSDGMRILASAETSEEAERLASEAGEPDPILHRPMAMR